MNIDDKRIVTKKTLYYGNIIKPPLGDETGQLRIYFGRQDFTGWGHTQANGTICVPAKDHFFFLALLYFSFLLDEAYAV